MPPDSTTLATLYSIIDRLGAPMAFIAIGSWLAYLAIKGPGMTLAAKLGDGFGALCKAGVDYLSQLSERVALLPDHVSKESVATREAVTSSAAIVREHVLRESVATREHVSDEVGKMRDRLSAAEDSIEVTVRAVTGQHQAYCGTPPLGLAVTPR